MKGNVDFSSRESTFPRVISDPLFITSRDSQATITQNSWDYLSENNDAS